MESKVSDVRVRHECEMCSTAVSAAVAMIMALATVGGVGLEAVVQAALELAMKHTHTEHPVLIGETLLLLNKLVCKSKIFDKKAI